MVQEKVKQKSEESRERRAPEEIKGGQIELTKKPRPRGA